MKLYCGIDLHSNNSLVSIINETDQVVFEKRLANEVQTRYETQSVEKCISREPVALSCNN